MSLKETITCCSFPRTLGLVCSISRYLVVCHSHRFIGQEKKLGRCIMRIFLATAGLIAFLSFIYKDSNYNFLNCMGKEENFIFNPKDQLGFGTWRAQYRFRMLYRHPFRVSNWMTALLFVAAVPILYYKIYAFRKKQDRSVEGIFCLLIFQIVHNSLIQGFLKHNRKIGSLKTGCPQNKTSLAGF